MAISPTKLAFPKGFNSATASELGLTVREYYGAVMMGAIANIYARAIVEGNTTPDADERTKIAQRVWAIVDTMLLEG